ncbi:hypothetical protein BDV27DRAFT_156971 [Aspergillus caelatus]|uniref:Helicase C-terminal domain-containing protein n=1 Tax=Aspergillus caelatus TaxID=61420 RepID=A0A5N7A7G8_9EURO|nr:uncharacterized protein BDV27DRAFT_156971 [Aspergillus caelatus]KAE8365378.1 hypothetical protein BDV27DRAFT_156971 [Aspergillus caelatus]
MARGKRPASSTPSARATKRRRTQPTDAGQACSSSTPLIEPQTVGMDPELPDVVRSEPHFGKRRLTTQLALNLPPLHKLNDIYRSITARALELNLGEFLQHIGSKPLRIVTACSGTESPLLALELVQDNLRKHFDRDFRFRHLFSAEIVPYKQRYIDNNFHPRLLFRDVTQLKDRVAQTAYGSLEKVPRNPDMLIAGFSCVDFSSLNNKRKTLDDSGESGGTFWGILGYAKRYRPRIVVLENVRTAPWGKIAEAWGGIDYFACHAEVDTKAYYLPQTRERGYMFCVDRQRMREHGLEETTMADWVKILSQFKRPASSPAGMFLMDPDDRRLEQIENDMTTRLASHTVYNWERYQFRHQNYRMNMGLGYRRPFTRSQEDGSSQMPDFTWQPWLRSMPERVWDTLDANFLRKLVEGYDMNHKERCIELSQGIEREIDTRAYGIVGCITPSGIPYLTTRGGPLCGLESLSLQGLPLDRLILARETQAELQQLAGNAMSSTVVGAAILSALIVGHKVLDKGSQQPLPKKEVPKHKRFELCHDHELVSGSINVDKTTDVTISHIQAQAASSARYCVCERQTAIKRDILRCKLCDHTACSDCAGNPTHDYQRACGLVRTQPLDFVSRLRSSLPARLVISGIFPGHYDVFKADISIDCPPSVWKKVLDAVALLMSDEFRCVDIKRSSVWTVTYMGKHGFISLVVSETWSCWSLHAKPSEDEPVVCLIREIFSKPIARMTPKSDSLLEGEWEILSPISSKCALTFLGNDHRVESFEAKCGIQIKGFPESKVWTQIMVDGSDDDIESFGIDVRGKYDLLPHCGTASSCLHKKPAVGNSPAVYFFLDPSKLDEPIYDSFIFSLEHKRTLGYASRSTIAEVSHKWRSSNLGMEPEYVNVYYRKSIKLHAITLACYIPDSPIICSNLKPLTSMMLSNRECRSANITLLSFETQATAIDSFWRKGPWEVANPVESPALLGDITWLLQKAVGFSAFQNWISVNEGKLSEKSGSPVCGVCVPVKPRIIWGRNTRGQIKAYEDPHDAALYERQTKFRPPPFLVFRQVDEEDMGHMRVTLNIQTLLHQAYGKLLNTNVSNNASFFWRIVPNYYDSRNLVSPDFSLVSNRSDSQSAQPPNFQLDLRPEQLRSLSWMIHRESVDIKSFIEEEVEEAFLPMLMWRAEGKVCVEKTVRGGVLADDVGYGKTAITLGLIDTQYSQQTEPEPIDGFIPTNATLIVVPKIMIKQWQSEITKFLKGTYRVLVIDGLAALGRKTVRDIQQADIVLASWAVFNSQNHYEKLQQFTGMPRVPPKAGRNFDDWFVKAHAVMMEQIQLLVDLGPRAVLESIQARRQEVNDNESNSIYIPSKRLKAGQYADVLQGHDPATEAGTQHADSSSEDGLSDSSEEEDPEVIRARVDKLLKLQPRTTAPTTLKMEKDDESDSEENEDEVSPVASRSGKAQGSGKVGQAVTRKRAPVKTAKVWDDRKEFGINNTAQQNYTTVKLPLLHAFSFNRLVIDEFTFANPERLVPLLKLQARSKWVLSSTPPLNDFADVNTSAPFLGIHLGIDDDDLQSQNARLKVIRKQRSEAESFQALQAPRSEEWHRRRHIIAQRFLDEFTRKNVAEIDEIPSSEHIILIQQSPAETAIYLELCKQLMTYNRLGRRGGRKGIRSDQEDRLDEVIGSSKTSDEALLKRCSSLALQGRWHNGVPEALTCSSLIETRLKQLEGLKEELMKKFRQAAWVYCACDLRHEKFHEFIESIKAHDFGDKTVTRKLYPLIKGAILTSQTDDWKLFFSDPAQVAEDSFDTEMRDETGVKEDDADDGEEVSSGGTSPVLNGNLELTNNGKQATGRASKRSVRGTKTKQGGKKEGAPELPVKPNHINEFKLILRTVTSGLRKLILEWVARERALRFLKTVHLVQTGSEIAECSSCHTTPKTANHINILGSCGHALCLQCTLKTVQKEECNVEGCRGSGKEFNVLDASTLKRDEKDRSAKYGGSKLDKMIEIIQAVPTDDRVLLFIQFPELIDVASKVLELAKIKYTAIIATDRKAAQKVQHFQEAGGFGENKVLILNLGSEMAAGLNLQCANHVIFLSPMFSQTQYDYDSSMTQAIGRARRYGQTKHVYIYHLLARMTIDTTLFQDRHGKVLVERDGKATLAAREEVEEWEMVKGEAMSVVVDNAF